MLCPCGAGLAYSECCEVFLSGAKNAPTPEALMRSRYTAHVKANIDYLRQTLARETRGSFDEKSVREWATESEWLGLEVLKAEGRQVEFVAKYRVKGEVIEHHEVALFRRDERENRWYFVDGDSHIHDEGKCHEDHADDAAVAERAPKVGRNDPCSCGSGKKFKKCCGK